MNDIIKFIKLLEDSGALIDGVTETVNHEIKKTRRWLSWSCVSTTSNFSVVKSISGRGVRRAGRGYMDKNF